MKNCGMDREKELFKRLEEVISQGRGPKVVRYLLNCLGGTPYIGGVFGASTAAWAESDQSAFNRMMSELTKIQSEKVCEHEKRLVLLEDKNQWVAAYLKFKPHHMPMIIDGSNVSGVTDNGPLDFVVTFDSPLPTSNYVLQYYGSEKVQLSVTEQTENCVRLRFEEPCPDLVTLVFLRI